MRAWDFSRFALSSCAALALLAGCGGSQPPIGALGAAGQRRATEKQSGRGGSWMLPEATTDDLVYTNNGADLYVLSFPQGKLVGTITGYDELSGECADDSGNVWITNASPPEVIDFGHGSTVPKTTLPLNAGAEASGCAVDATTGNLAVTVYYPSAIAIFPKASGTPRYYSDPDIGGWGYCAYDNKGNLFAESKRSELAELPVGSSSLQRISLDKEIGVGSIQWVDSYLAIASDPGGPHGPTSIEHVSISGTTGTVIGKTALHNVRGRAQHRDVQYWIDGNNIVGPDTVTFDFWRYPRSGKPTNIIKHLGELWYTTVSVAPH